MQPKARKILLCIFTVLAIAIAASCFAIISIDSIKDEQEMQVYTELADRVVLRPSEKRDDNLSSPAQIIEPEPQPPEAWETSAGHSQPEEATVSQTQSEHVEESAEQKPTVPEETTEPASEIRQDGSGQRYVYYGVDETRLIKINKEYCGWLVLQNVFELPVVYTGSSTKYLKKDFYGNKNDHGCLFAYGDEDIDDIDNLVIYGHTFKNSDAMFGALHKYADNKYAAIHNTIIFDRFGAQPERYELIAVINCSASDNVQYMQSRFASQSAKDIFADKMKGLSLYDTGAEETHYDSFVTLSTCDRKYDGKNGRLVLVFGRTAK